MNKIKLTCKVHTRKLEEKIFYDNNNILHIYIKEIPEKGSANNAIIKLLSKTLSIPQYQIFITSGFATTIKIIEIITNYTIKKIETILKNKK